MSKGQVLLVGSVPLPNSEDVFRAAGPTVGEHVTGLPDGEPGDRNQWINYLALRTFYMHPDLQTVKRPAARDGEEQWIPADYGDGWIFKVREGVTELEFDDLGYAGASLRAYLDLRRLKEEGVLPEHIRLQVAFPMSWSAVLTHFATSPGDFDIVIPAYEEAVRREIDKLLLAVPAAELSIQFDVCLELLDIAGAFPFPTPPDPWDRYLAAMERLSPSVPEEALLGYHLCYGDLGHEHAVQPEDLGLSVKMANAAVGVAGRRVDFFHMAVPRDRTDEAYFAPLADLEIGDARVYLGLVHMTDGEDGGKARIASAKRYLDSFGIATECGFGRRPAEQVPELLQLHADLTAHL